MTDCFELSSSRCPGKVIIFNHYKYAETPETPKRNLEPRPGTNKDVGNLCNEFANLKFEMHTYQDKKKKEVIDKLQKLAKKNYLHYGCVIVIVLTHGDANGQLEAHDAAFNTSDVWTPFLDCESLQNKPKIFIFQACRGSHEEGRRLIDTDAPPSTNCYPRKKDVLIVYSTVEGNVSYRLPESGTWYVQELTKELKNLKSRPDLITLLTRVNYNVLHYSSASNSANVGEIGQTPTFVSTLTKPVTLKDVGLTSDDNEADKEYAMWQEKKYALILYDAAHAPHTARMQEALTSLNFTSELEQVSSKNDVDHYVTEIAGKVEKGTCLFIVLMCKFENETFVLGSNSLPFSHIPKLIKYDKYENLLGCPKLIFYLDRQVHDGNAIAKDETVKSEVLKIATEHSDFLIVKSYSKAKTDDIIGGLSKCLDHDLVTILTSCVGDDASIESSLRRQIIFRTQTPKDVKTELLKSEIQRTLLRPCCADFTGRIPENNILQQLYKKKFSDGIDVLVYGPPGVGKTELVYKFLKTSINHDNVIWIHSARNEFILDSFKTKIKSFNMSAENNKELVSKVYSSHIYTDVAKTVLVFDEVISYKDIEQYLPEKDYMTQLFIIVTSNDSRIEASSKVPLQYFSDNESKRLVQHSTEDENLLTKICTELKPVHGNIPAILSKFCNAITSDQAVKDAVQNPDIQNIENILNLVANQNITLATDTGYNKQIDTMFDVLIKQLDSEKNGNYARDVLQFISVIDHEQIPYSLFSQLKFKDGYELLNKLSIVQLTSDFIESNSILRKKIKKKYEQDLQVITNQVIQQYKCQGPDDNKIFKNPLLVKSAIKFWNMIVQYPESISEAASIGIAILKQKGETIENKNKFVTTFGQQIKQNLSSITDKKKEDLLTLCFKCALVCYKSENYKNCTGYVESLLNLTSSSPILTRAKALQIFVNAKTTNDTDHMQQFEKFFNKNLEAIQHLLQLAKACRDASFLFAEENRVENYGQCWQDLIEASSNKNDTNVSVKKQMWKCIEILFQHKKYAYTRELCSFLSDQNLTSSTNGVLILNYKACCLYHLAKDSTEEKSKQLNQAFATWKDLYDNHYTPQLNVHFDAMLECAKLLDNNKVGPNLDWVFSKIKTERGDGLVKVLQILRQTRENAKLSKDVALCMSQRMLLPQPLREPARDRDGNIVAPGSVEYISGLEIKHGKKALGWMERHISLEAVTYLVQNGADVRATGVDSDSTILHYASLQGVLDVVVYAVKQKAYVSVKDKDGQTALYLAAYRGHLDVVKYLIFQGADVSVKNRSGETALHCAACNGHIDVVKQLISQGAYVNALDKDGQTALHIAAYRGRLDVVRHLVTSGADVNFKDNEGRTALDLARIINKPAVAEYLQSPHTKKL